MSLNDLSQGAIAQMIQTADPASSVQNPVCQILSIKKIQASATSASNVGDRYRIILSDGIHYAQAMLASQKRSMVESGELEKHCLIRISQYASNSVQNRRILILLDLQVTHAATADRLGTPTNVDEAVKTEGGVKQEGGASALGNFAAGNSSAGRTTPATSAAGASKAGGAGRPGGSSVHAGMPIYPIEGLSPYQNRWTIKARVTSKSDIRHWSNQRGEGKLFSVNLLDDSGEIKATGFNDAVDRFYPLLQENHVYLISKARVNIAKKQFSNLQNEYEITFENSTEIEECTDASDVPEVKYEFVRINELESVEPNQTCDVIGVLDSYGELSEIVSKASQRPVQKRELTLVDQGNKSVRLTLWGKNAETFPNNAGVDEKPVIAFKGVKVGDFGGRSLSMFSSSTMLINPDITESHVLRGWYDNDGAHVQFQPFTNAGVNGGAMGAGGAGGNMAERRTIAQVKDENLGMSEKPDYFNVRATVVYIKQENLYYTACPSDGCNKKVSIDHENNWRCEKCDRSYEAPEYRYILSTNVADATGQIWLSGFNEDASKLIGMSAGELHKLREDSESEFTAALHRAANRMYLFNCRAKMDTFNDTARVRYTISRASPVDFAKAGTELVNAIKAYM
ncbi:probable Replication factor-A protein 1 [Melanopsichium pennsylvanicum]|uniref:Replication protein A subunit n=2 Tax=Melanopsichium pennsylvanicum TaxID=63383 RepID=A0AAJ4XM12_9BASI|nr:probable Replication factor-A protein 1 [Melanopsichium pennsylvanicum 4]SNX84757.1 probable Replication factor-A protein 1 [Melanopsichium pennsylvanicum]